MKLGSFPPFHPDEVHSFLLSLAKDMPVFDVNRNVSQGIKKRKSYSIVTSKLPEHHFLYYKLERTYRP